MKGRVPGSVPTLVNGEPAGSLPVTDRGLAYGDGVFETLRVAATGPVLYEAHLQRLTLSCQRLNIPLDIARVHAHIQQLLESSAQTQDETIAHRAVQDSAFQNRTFSAGVIKLIVTRGDGGRGYVPPAAAEPRIIVQWHSLPTDIEQWAEQGIECALIDQPVSVNPLLAGMKHLNRLDQVLASQTLQRLTAHRPQLREVLMPDPAGWLIEGSRSNVFMVLDDQLCTPDLSQAGVAGVMREYLLQAAAQRGYQCCIRPIDTSELALASEVFICNSVIGIWPVREIWTGAHAELRLAAWSQYPLARWAQALFETCLANGRLSLRTGKETQRPDSFS